MNQLRAKRNVKKEERERESTTMAVFNENHDYDKISRVTKPVTLLQNLISNVGGMKEEREGAWV